LRSFPRLHGAATGIDRSCAEACGDLGFDQEAHPARRDEPDHPEAEIRHDERNRP
jgi:hypothetical protein